MHPTTFLRSPIRSGHYLASKRITQKKGMRRGLRRLRIPFLWELSRMA